MVYFVGLILLVSPLAPNVAIGSFEFSLPLYGQSLTALNRPQAAEKGHSLGTAGHGELHGAIEVFA